MIGDTMTIRIWFWWWGEVIHLKHGTQSISDIIYLYYFPQQFSLFILPCTCIQIQILQLSYFAPPPPPTLLPAHMCVQVCSTASFWCTNCTNSVHNTTAAQSVTTHSGDNINLVTRPSSDTVIVVTWSPGHINTELASPEQLASKCELRMWGCLLYMFATVSTSRAPGTAPDPRHYGDTRSLLVLVCEYFVK